ncbi:MAG: hypothetical protein ABW360_02095 [Phenylobacterium sp.]
MKTTIAALAALATLAAAPALAQAPSSTTTTTTTTTTTAAALSIETTPIETLAANPAAKAVLDKDIPGLTSHEAYDQFKSMTLKQVQPMSQGALTDEMLAAVQADLDKLPK